MHRNLSTSRPFAALLAALVSLGLWASTLSAPPAYAGTAHIVLPELA